MDIAPHLLMPATSSLGKKVPVTVEILVWMTIHGSQGDHSIVPDQDVCLLVIVIVVHQSGLEQGAVVSVTRARLCQNGKVDWILSNIDR